LGLKAFKAHWTISYHVSVCAHDFYRGYKSRGWVLASPTQSHCSPIGEVAAINVVEAENPNMVDNPMEMVRVIGGELPGASDGDGPALSARGAEISTGASDDDNSRTYYFGPSTITRGKIKEMVEKRYFAEGKAWEPRTETVLEPDDDEAIVYEDLFVTVLRMPPHPALGDILLSFQA
jgi:hypothetical protein